MQEIQQFLYEYDKAVIAGDIVKISSHFYNQFTLSTPTELWRLDNNEEFLSNLVKSFNRYKKLGAQVCKMLATDIINFNSNHYMANVKWGLINDKNMPFMQFDISYCIKGIDDSWKFIFVIDHNEPK